MYQMIIVKDVNYLETHQKKLATYKSPATPWLRTTVLNNTKLDHLVKEENFCELSKTIYPLGELHHCGCCNTRCQSYKTQQQKN